MGFQPSDIEPDAETHTDLELQTENNFNGETMNQICAECAYRRLAEYGAIIRKTRFDDQNRIKTIIGNARRPYICFDCGHKMNDGTACAVIHAEGEETRNFILPADELPKHYTEDWGNYGGGKDR